MDLIQGWPLNLTT